MKKKIDIIPLFIPFQKNKYIFAYLYSQKKLPSSFIIYLGGAPGYGDQGNSERGIKVAELGWGYLAPDYIGYNRSDGKFSFKGCLETIKKTEEFLLGKIKGIRADKFKKKIFHIKPGKIKRIVVAGSSFGGAIAPFLSLLNSTTIKEIVLIAPVTDWKKLNKINRQEIEVFLTSILIKMRNIYRRANTKEWKAIVNGSNLKTNPIYNIHLLKDKKVYIFHGNKDKSIPWKLSYEYYNKIKSFLENESVYFFLIKNGDHSWKTSLRALELFIKIFKN